jgi:cytochrome P450
VDLYYNPLEYAFQDDPYGLYARLREEAPIYRNEDVDFWAISRYADVNETLRDNQRFSNSHGPLMERKYWEPGSSKFHSIVAMDPPEHGIMRGLIAGSFTPRKLAELEPQIRRYARGYVEAAVEKGTFDIVTGIVGPLAMDTLCIIMGVPESDRTEVQRLVSGTVHREDGAMDISEAEMQAYLTLRGYYTELVAERRRQRQDDLISELIDADVEGRNLTDDEILALLHLLGGAGTETMVDLMANCWYWAWKFPEQREIAFGRDAHAGWIEETLRYDSAVQSVIRLVKEDVRFHGVTVPAGSQLLVLIGSANRDGEVFPDPDRYDLNRRPKGVISFGAGPHMCIGNTLGRSEGKIMMEELVSRIRPDYDIDESGAKRVYRAAVRGFATLPTTVTAR